MSDVWKFRLVGAGTQSPFGGYISASDRTTLSRRYMVKGSKNVYLKDSGTISVRPGTKRRGVADSTIADTKESYEWDTSLGATRVLRVNDGKLQVESDIVTSGTYQWYDLLTLTNTRVIFDTWWYNSLKKDILLFVQGTDDIHTWSGGLGKIVSTTANTIVLASAAATSGFAASGTVIINGTEYPYSGISGSTLTGVSGDPTGEAADSVVLQKTGVDATTPASDFVNDFIKVINNQVYAGSTTSRLVYISKNDDYTDYTQSTPRAPGEGDILTLDEPPTGIGEREGKAHISTKKAWYVVSFNQITVGSNLSEQTLVDKIPMATKKGALRHEFIDTVGNDLVYLSEDQQLHTFGTFRNINQPQFPSLSEQIKEELEDEDFTGGHLRSVGDFIYLTAPNNGRVWLHETRTEVNTLGNIQKKRLWHSPFIWNITRIAVIDGVTYGHSNANPQLYQLWNTLQWHDDSPSDDYIPYDSVAAFAYTSANRYDLLQFDKIFFEGYATPGSDVRGAVTYEYKGERAVQEIVLSESENQAEFYIGDVGIALGDNSLGDNPLGDAVSEEEADQEMTPKFRVIPEVQELHVFEYQVRVYSTEPDSRWELLCLGANDTKAEEVPTALTR